MSQGPPISQNPIRVLILARVLDVGGIERDVSKFARRFSRYGVEPHVACFNPGGARWQEIKNAGLPLLTVPVRSFKSKSAFDGARILRRYLAENRIDIVHAFDVPADIFGVPIARLSRIPVLSSQLCYRGLCSIGARVLMLVIDRLATGVFVNCEAIANHLEADWMVERNHIYVCHNGFEPEEFNPDSRKRLPELEGASVVIGTVALLRPEKNLGLLIDAFEKLSRFDPKARLLIVGSGPMEESLKSQAANHGISQACVFREAVDKPANIMRSMDIFVLPSKSEAFSNSLLEAMACGCCPVASRIGGTPEMVSDGESGRLFDSGDTEKLAEILINLSKSPRDMKRMAETASSFVHAHFTIDQATRRLANIYKKLLYRNGLEKEEAQPKQAGSSVMPEERVKTRADEIIASNRS